MSFSIRTFKDDDANELWELHSATLAASGFPLAVAEWDSDLHAIKENYVDTGGGFLVVEDEDRRLIGMGGFVPLPSDSKSAELKRVRVHPEFQRQGIGEVLLGALESAALKAGFSRLQLDTANGKIQSFYLKNGYRFVRKEFESSYEFFFYEKLLLSPIQN